MPPEHEFLVRQIIGSDADISWLLRQWPYPPDANSGGKKRDHRASYFAGLLRPRTPSEWPANLDLDEMLRKGIYSPLQPLLWECAQIVPDKMDLEHPFHFSLVSLLIHTLLDHFDPEMHDQPWPPDEVTYADTRKALQALFQLREEREEGERLSIEIRFPLDAMGRHEFQLKKLAQVYGRGVGVATGPGLSQRAREDGATAMVEDFFDRHEGAPSVALYTLNQTYSHIKDARRVHAILRRDGHVTIAIQENPILEFYDGGWHVVDVHSGRVAVDALLDAWFPGRADDLGEYCTRLAYHMGSHWHGAILAICREQYRGKKLRLQKVAEFSRGVRESISELLPTEVTNLKITEIPETKMGRILLTAALQDGAVMIGPDATVRWIGRMVKESKDVQSGGARTRAAKTFGTHGVAIAISEDGTIRLFSGPHEGDKLLPSDGLRIH